MRIYNKHYIEKKLFKKRGIFNVLLLLMGAILSISLLNLHNQNKEYLEQIKDLKFQLNVIEEEFKKSVTELQKTDLLRYKNTVFEKKFPDFSKIAGIVFRKSKEYGFNPNLIMGLIQIESNFDQFAVSSRGALGLMQINYSVWKNVLNIDVKKIFEIEYNIDLGLKILKRYHKISRGNILRTLHLYNNGFLYNNNKYKYKVTSTVFY